MTESLFAALTTGGLSLLGVVITAVSSSRKTDHRIQTAMAVTDTKLEELTREVRTHNHFAQRMPVVEEQIKVINHRLEDLEAFHKSGGMI